MAETCVLFLVFHMPASSRTLVLCMLADFHGLLGHLQSLEPTGSLLLSELTWPVTPWQTWSEINIKYFEATALWIDEEFCYRCSYVRVLVNQEGHIQYSELCFCFISSQSEKTIHTFLTLCQQMENTDCYLSIWFHKCTTRYICIQGIGVLSYLFLLFPSHIFVWSKHIAPSHTELLYMPLLTNSLPLYIQYVRLKEKSERYVKCRVLAKVAVC